AQLLPILQKLMRYRDSLAFPRDYRGHNVAAAVIGRPQSQFEQQIVIAAGRNDGVRLHDPVVTNDGLVGQVTKVASRSAPPTLMVADAAKALVLVFLVAILQASVFNQVVILGGTPNLVLVALVALALLRGSVLGAAGGFFAGLVLDTANLETLGVTSLLLT